MIKREKRRYLALEAVTNQTIDEWTVFNAVQDSILRLFGEHGASKTNLKQMKYIPEKQQIVIRCSHTMLQQVRAAIVSIVEINEKTTTIHVLGVSGTLKALSKKI